MGALFEHPNEGKRAVGPPEWDVNLFNVRAGGRGVCDDMAVQGLIPGSASVCLSVCLSVCPGCVGGWSGSEFRGKDRTKRFRRARSTKSEREVGSDSLILSEGQPFCVAFRDAALRPPSNPTL